MEELKKKVEGEESKSKSGGDDLFSHGERVEHGGGFMDKEKANAIATLVQSGVEERAILSI